MSSFIVTIDQGSSATKVLAFDHRGRQAYRSTRPLRIVRPQPTHVEQDPVHVLQETKVALKEVLSSIGGAARKLLLQFQSDLLGLPIRHSAISDATALGCAFLTGLQAGFWKDIGEIQESIQIDVIFYPRLTSARRQSYLSQWHSLLKARDILPSFGPI